MTDNEQACHKDQQRSARAAGNCPGPVPGPSRTEQEEITRAVRLRKQNARDRWGPRWEWLSELLYRHDPIHLAAIGCPTDEYEPEVETILPRLEQLRRAGRTGVLEVRQVVWEEFAHWFGADIAGQPDDDPYGNAAQEISDALEGRAPLPSTGK